MKTILMTAVLSAAVGVAAIPARAQLSYHVDDHGNLVYTNDESQHARKAAAEKAAAASEANRNNSQLSAANSTPAAQSPGADVLRQLVQETAHKHNVDPALVSAVISTESNWNTAAISRRGAQGLMQLIPETAQHLGVFNPFDATQNVEAGVTYLSSLLERYNGDLPRALAAYLSLIHI